MFVRRVRFFALIAGLSWCVNAATVIGDCSCRWNVTTDADGMVTYQLIKACETSDCVCPLPPMVTIAKAAVDKKPQSAKVGLLSSTVSDPVGCDPYVQPFDIRNQTEVQMDNINLNSFALYLPTQSYGPPSNPSLRTAVLVPFPSPLIGTSRTTIGTIRPGVRITIDVTLLTTAVAAPPPTPATTDKVYWLSTPFRKASDNKTYWRHLPLPTKDAATSISFYRAVEEAASPVRHYRFTIKCVADP